MFNGGPFTLLQLVLLIEGPQIIDEEAPIDDEPPADDPLGDMEEALIVDNESGLEFFTQ